MYIVKFDISDEQLEYAHAAVFRSQQQKFANYWEKEAEVQDEYKLRLCGFLGEVLFADVYGLARPAECYGLNGQDKGVDFVCNGANIDIKTVRLAQRPRRADYFNYMIPLRIIDKQDSSTDVYFCIGLLEDGATREFATAYFAGSAKAADLRARKVGRLVKAGEVLTFNTRKITMDKDVMRFNVGQISPVKITDKLQKMPNFAQTTLD